MLLVDYRVGGPGKREDTTGELHLSIATGRTRVVPPDSSHLSFLLLGVAKRETQHLTSLGRAFPRKHPIPGLDADISFLRVELLLSLLHLTL